jgi:AraC family transcriptional regulator
MDLLDKMNDALDYIEKNLPGEIVVDEAARIACCSVFNFQRMFSFIADVSLAEYIRRRRLSLAAMELLTTGTKVIDVAAKYGYESPVSFARAFSAVHDLSPSDVRKSGVKIKSYPRITFEITIKGVNAMNYRIETKEAFRAIGYKIRVSTDNDVNFVKIPEFWAECDASGKCGALCAYNDNPVPQGLMGICANEEGSTFDYFIATASTKPLGDGMSELFVPSTNYVVFEAVGPMPESIQNTWKRAFTEWFPTSGYDIAPGAQVEWYIDEDGSSADCRSEIWIPIRKKN